VPLLTREGEVRIARRIERGERRIMNALARSAWVHDEIRQIGERIKGSDLGERLRGGEKKRTSPRRSSSERSCHPAPQQELNQMDLATKRMAKLKPGGRAHKAARYKAMKQQVKLALELSS